MRSRGLGFLFVGIAAGFSVWAWPMLPGGVATHFVLNGTPNGFSSRWVAAVLLPGVMLVIQLLRDWLPGIDPRRENYTAFIETYWLLANWGLLFALVLHGATLGQAIGWPISLGRVIPPAAGVLFIVVGNYLGRIEPNWFIGIRTPWTLSSDQIWRATHRTAAWLLVLLGVVWFLSSILRLPTSVLIGLSVAIGAVPLVQSYILWRREQRASH